MHQLLKRGARLANRGLNWLRAWPWFVASIVLGFLIRENFPFSRRLSPAKRAVVGSLGLVSARLKMDENREITVPA
jgi:hypothetical protein